MTNIGANAPRRDAEDKLRGRTRFTVDTAPPGLLFGVLVRAPVASATIRGVDAIRARAMPGVRAIVGPDDAPGRYGIGVADHPLFADGRIRHVGEPLLAIAADTLDQAQAAAATVALDLEETPAAVTMAEALDPHAPLIHPDWDRYEVLVEGGSRGRNIAWEATVVRGDSAAAFARDDVHVIESEFRVGRQNQAPLEPRVCVAAYDDGRFHIETSTQVPWSVRNATARFLGVRPADVRVTVPAVGGGFGGKFEWGLEPFAALLARASGRPVKLCNSLEEEMLTALCRENAEIRIRSAVTDDGDILAREAVVLMDCGAYGGEQPFLTTMTAHTLGGNYRLGSVRLVSRAVYTNTPPTGAFRACNGVYNTFALERHTDEICKRIGIDPLEFRKRSVLGDGDLGATGQVFEGDVLRPMLEITERARDDDATREGPRGWLYGRAAVVGTWFVFVGPSAATVNVNADGSVALVTSAVEIGSGATQQAIPQIVAEALGVKAGDVVVRPADTDAAGYDVGVGGGRTTVSIGAASRAACEDAKRKLFDVAADMLEASPDDLEIVEGGIAVSGSPGAFVELSAVATHAHATIGPIAGSGSFTGVGTPSMPGCAAGHMIEALDIPIFAVHDCELAVDPETGRIEILSYRVVQDVGRAINPRAIRGQIQGGVVQGLGYAVHEEIAISSDGDIDQRGFETYRLPLALDAPAVDAHLFEGAPSLGPLGAKGAGEIPILNVAAAVACAVGDATGCDVSELPLTPPRVLALLKGRAEPIRLDHVGPGWADNVLTDPGALLEAAGVATGHG